MKAGRPTKLTPAVHERLLQALRGGNFRATACAWAGVSQRAFREWMAAGKAKPRSPLGDFRRAVMEAEKAAEIRAVALVMKAAATDAKHAEWWLAHRHPRRWAVNTKVELTGKNGGPIQTLTRPDLSKLSDEELDTFAALLRRANTDARRG